VGSEEYSEAQRTGTAVAGAASAEDMRSKSRTTYFRAVGAPFAWFSIFRMAFFTRDGFECLVEGPEPAGALLRGCGAVPFDRFERVLDFFSLAGSATVTFVDIVEVVDCLEQG